MLPPLSSPWTMPLAWPSDIKEGAIDEVHAQNPSLQKPDPKLKDGGINYVW